MKTASMPPLRVEPELRKAAEAVLHKGESLSHFMEDALKAGIQRRKSQQQFIDRGLASAAEARQLDEYFSAEEVFDELHKILQDAEKTADQ